MLQIKRFFCCLFLALVCPLISTAQQPENIEKKVENPIGVAEEEKKSLRQVRTQQVAIVATSNSGEPAEVFIEAENQGVEGNAILASGNVQVTYADMLIIADRATYNKATADLIAEGNVFFEQQGQRMSGERIELNAKTKRGTIFTSTAFTNHTPDGTMVVIDSKWAHKTGEDTYNLENATVTACQEGKPHWSFTAKRARIRLDHTAKVYNAFFRVKGVPVFYLPYASISISKKDRSSGFLLPSSGSSSIKGRTFHTAYYQTLGRSADVLFRTDVYTKRGLGIGFDFRVKPDENSHITFGSFTVLDRVFGLKGDKQGGTSFYADAVQYFKNGFVAVADVNVTSNFTFRQVFGENIQTAISPEERTIFYLNKNWKSYSFNAFFGEQSAFIYDQKNLKDETVKVRQLPSVELSQRNTKVSESLPFYFSFDSSLEGVRRSETAGNITDLKTPSIVQRLDFFPRLTFPLRSLAGFTLTPTVGVRSTFYSDSLDPVTQQVVGVNVLRKYADVEVDLRPPAMSRIFRHGNGDPWFKHVIEPFIQYHRIDGIDQVGQTLRVDERDVVTNTNDLTFGISNSILVRRSGPNGAAQQPHELLNVTLSQKYYFDPSFGGALQEGVRNQFSPLNSVSGFATGGFQRQVSPLNLSTRLRPNSALFADLRLNYDTVYNELRDVVFGGGFSKGLFSFSQSWYHTRFVTTDQMTMISSDNQMTLQSLRALRCYPATRRSDVWSTSPDATTLSIPLCDPSTLPGNQMDMNTFLGNPGRGPFGGLGISYDFRDARLSGDLLLNANGDPMSRRLINLTATAGWAWDCCSMNVQRSTFNVGQRNESRVIFAFTLKGIGTFGTQNIGQRRR